MAVVLVASIGNGCGVATRSVTPLARLGRDPDFSCVIHPTHRPDGGPSGWALDLTEIGCSWRGDRWVLYGRSSGGEQQWWFAPGARDRAGLILATGRSLSWDGGFLEALLGEGGSGRHGGDRWEYDDRGALSVHVDSPERVA